MTPQDIAKLVKTEIANAGPSIHSLGINLNKSLVLPRKINCKDGAGPGVIELWLVMEEHNGYQVVFSEENKQFGLVTGGTFIGFHGSLSDTLAGM
jgi:hypothetical protein